MPGSEPCTGDIKVNNEGLPLKMLTLYVESTGILRDLLQSIDSCPMKWEER